MPNEATRRLYFSGVVLPVRAQLSVQCPEVEHRSDDGSVHARLKLTIWNNEVTVLVESTDPDVYTLRNLVKAEVEFIVSLGGFMVGYGYHVEITKVFDERLDYVQVFGIEIPVLEQRASQRIKEHGGSQEAFFNEGINAIMPICMGEHGAYLRRCFTDLAHAIKYPDDTAFYCRRAIESLKERVAIELGVNAKDKQWKALTSVVGTKLDQLDALKTHSGKARHGVPLPLTGELRRDLLLQTWDIVETFIDRKLSEIGSPFRIQRQDADHPPACAPGNAIPTHGIDHR